MLEKFNTFRFKQPAKCFFFNKIYKIKKGRLILSLMGEKKKKKQSVFKSESVVLLKHFVLF